MERPDLILIAITFAIALALAIWVTTWVAPIMFGDSTADQASSRLLLVRVKGGFLRF
jgi:hypothetical protein